MAEDYSYDALVAFLEYAADIGLLKANTVGGLKTAASKVADDLTEQEAADVRVIDLEQLFQRFVNRNKVSVSPSTLRVYKRRLRTAIEEFTRWREDPTDYKPAIGKRRSSKKGSDSSTPQRSARPQDDESRNSPPSEPATKALSFPFPLRPDFLATIQVPRDLKRAEAERLAAFIKTLATDEEEG